MVTRARSTTSSCPKITLWMASRARPTVSRAASADFTIASSRLVGAKADAADADPAIAWAVVAIMRLSSIPLAVPPRPQCGWKRSRFQAAPVDHSDATIGPDRRECLTVGGGDSIPGGEASHGFVFPLRFIHYVQGGHEGR